MASNKAARDEAIAQLTASGRGNFVSGLDINLGTINWEYVPALMSWLPRMSMYQRMGNDGKIASTLRLNQLPLISAVRWSAEGGTDEQKDLISSNFLRKGNPAYWCDTSWTQRLFESLQSLQYGISIFGKSWEVVDGYQILRSMTYLTPKSLGGVRGPFEWDGTGARLVAIHRSYKKADGGFVTDERIPIEDVFPIVWNMAGENWEGVPMIRPMYRAFTEKDLASKIQMIDLQNRGVGIPKGKLGPNDSAKAAATLWEMAKDLRGGSKERQALMLTDGQELGFLTSEGTVLDSGPIITEKNNELAAAAGADFEQSGQQASGSRASSSVLAVAHMQDLDATREIIQEQWNHGCGYLKGPVEEVQDRNFTDVEEYAKIVGTRVSPTDQLDNIPNINEAIQNGSLTHDLGLENYVRKSMGLPSMTPAEFEKARTSRDAVRNIGGRPQEVGDPSNPDPRDDGMSRAFGLTEKKTLLDETRRTRNARSYGWVGSKVS